jgi:hypothetical protein
MADVPKVETTTSEVTKTIKNAPPPKRPDPSFKMVKKKVKKKGPPPLLEIVLGIVLFISIVAIATSKVNKMKETGDTSGYYTQKEDKPTKKTTSNIKNKDINLDHFSELERNYILDNCKKVSGDKKNKCIAKSINELMDLY